MIGSYIISCVLYFCVSFILFTWKWALKNWNNSERFSDCRNCTHEIARKQTKNLTHTHQHWCEWSNERMVDVNLMQICNVRIVQRKPLLGDCRIWILQRNWNRSLHSLSNLRIWNNTQIMRSIAKWPNSLVCEWLLSYSSWMTLHDRWSCHIAFILS